MSKTENLLYAEYVDAIPAPKNETPFFLLAWWHGGWWKIFPRMYRSADGEDILADIERLQRRGWSHITIVRLPCELDADNTEGNDENNTAE